MSNVYIQEPATNGKVLIVTSVGDIDIELWPREAPKACRNFVQLCLEGYYDGTIFHRIIKGFIAQGGDPTGTGTGGESIYGQPFKDEIHQRLRFSHRGIVAMANAGPNDNGSQFFFTFDETPELLGKHTIFGKVTGDTIYNMVKLAETLVDKDDRPIYDQIIRSTKVLSNPFDDIIIREKKTKKTSSKLQEKKGTKNFSLLSFGEEAEEDEEEVDAVTNVMRNKSKSSHDFDDPSLSTVPAVDVVQLQKENDDKEVDDGKKKEDLATVRKKLKKNNVGTENDNSKNMSDGEPEEPEELDKKTKRLLERDAIRAEVKKLKREMKNSNNPKEETKTKEPDSDAYSDEDNQMVKEVKEQRKKFKEIKKTQLKKGSEREKKTLDILSKFQNKLHEIRENGEPGENSEPSKSDAEEDDWLGHELRFEDKGPVVAKDASLDNSESFEMFDPRNPMNKRRREKGKVDKK
ncbi:Spliceosome-associated protein CWC27 [Nymphon striatum]|nr:Spliceosome-associated protein CWC27 [Nymphon striatum]